MNAERGAASVLVVGVIGALVAALLLVAPLAVLLGAAHRAAAAADAAALAAADTALGLVTGVPCDRARAVAEADGARLTACAQRADLVRVRVVVTVLSAPVPAESVAGPPPE